MENASWRSRTLCPQSQPVFPFRLWELWGNIGREHTEVPQQGRHTLMHTAPLSGVSSRKPPLGFCQLRSQPKRVRSPQEYQSNCSRVSQGPFQPKSPWDCRLGPPLPASSSAFSPTAELSWVQKGNIPLGTFPQSISVWEQNNQT